MRKFNFVLLSACIVIGVAACSSTKVEKLAECVFPNSQESAPGWVCDRPVEAMPVAAMGSAVKSDAGYDFMKQMATTGARVKLVQNMRAQVQNMIRQYAETTGAASKETVDLVNTSVTKQITDESLQGTKIERGVIGPDGTLYILVGLDEAGAQKLTEAAIKTSMNNDQATWKQFRAKTELEELAADIAKQRMEVIKQRDN
jgi:hypothetical protein